MNSLSIIIPSRNGENLSQCLGSILRHCKPLPNIIVVDDGLPVDWNSVEWVKVIPGEKPFCFARNINIGIKAAGQDDVLLMNDDALLLTPGGFSAMQEALYRRPDIGLCSAVCNNVGNINQWKIGTQGWPPVFEELRQEMREDRRMVCFVAVLIRRTTINSVGLLDEIFTDYGLDDDDYCLRVRMAGLRIGIFDGCEVDHSKLQSTFRPGNVGGDFQANLQRFKDKWGKGNMEL